MYTSDLLPENPFPGLRPFESHESQIFFGRESQCNRLLRMLSSNRFVAVVGTSGSGKSSLVRAGLLPALFGGFLVGTGSHWRVAIMRPGGEPVRNLALGLCQPGVLATEDAGEDATQFALAEVTLRRSGLGLAELVRQSRLPSSDNLLIVVDQFEELFRYRLAQEGGRDEAELFVRLLLEASQRYEQNIYVVLTMRSDFLGDCSVFWGLPEAISGSQFLVPRMMREELREAITGPVEVCGGHLTDPLVNRLLNDVTDNPDQLPILQHALMRTWERWAESATDGEEVGLEDYEAVGTMAGALSRHADEAFDELTDDRSRRVAEVMFKSLTERAADGREVRRPTSLGQICYAAGVNHEEVARVVEVFRRPGRSFLMPPAGFQLTPDTVIDISHESLIRIWARLRRWVSEEYESARVYRRLAETAALYRKGSASLLTGADLQVALEWHEKARPNAAWAARYHPHYEDVIAFLDLSRRENEAALAEQRERERRELEQERREMQLVRLSARRLRYLVAALALMMVMISGLTVYAYAQKKKAEDANARTSAANKELEVVNDELMRARDVAQNERKKAEEAADIESARSRQLDEVLKHRDVELARAREQGARAERARRQMQDTTNKLMEEKRREVQRVR